MESWARLTERFGRAELASSTRSLCTGTYRLTIEVDVATRQLRARGAMDPGDGALTLVPGEELVVQIRRFRLAVAVARVTPEGLIDFESRDQDVLQQLVDDHRRPLD